MKKKSFLNQEYIFWEGLELWSFIWDSDIKENKLIEPDHHILVFIPYT